MQIKRSVTIKPGVDLDLVSHILESYLESENSERTGYLSACVFGDIYINGMLQADVRVHGTDKTIIIQLNSERIAEDTP